MIKQVTQGGSVGVKVNDEESNFFLTGRSNLRGFNPVFLAFLYIFFLSSDFPNGP
jgi:hypothetical protein